MLRALGRQGLRSLSNLGGSVVVAARVAGHLPRLERHDVAARLAAFGWESLPVVGATSLLIGAILVLQASLYVQRFGVQVLVGWGVGYGVLRQLGPLVAALVFSGRVGSRNAAELAAMQTRDQLAGLAAVGVDALPAVVAPRAAAMILALVLLTLLGDVVAIAGGAAAAWVLLALEPAAFLRSLAEHCTLSDLASNVTKAAVFGNAIAAISAHAGLSARGGAAAVGRAATDSVVRSAIAIVALDLAVSPLY